ncbi:hypothetical protein HBA43_19605 [Providencia rettgeri]|uniref:hypothetical protein n=1 Tax=Providencia rettgeri TaxID=587 RepID=UPI00141A09F7|nr:hypothetical protein [Providencia rettgeri]EJD6581738.1 hypothetical protein [Providencia rettgeri]NIA76386.1 hypothetical protein [Providencia rettgeri]NIA80597.1 hypothetical protein [Providencia rettgeri]NIB03795.1 hypothetical protein [Providencia rettgeri]NIB08003.1 hypothetical protein [Providencia rettgeri]
MDIKKIRQTRLREWFKDKTLPTKEKSYLSQLMGGNSSFGEKAARRLEQTYGMPDGFLDQDNSVTSISDVKYKELSKEQIELLELYDSLPKEEAQKFLREMKAKKAHYDAIFEEMLKKRGLDAS